MATLGRSGDVALAERFARALAAELQAVGITLDYAPVLDIHTNPKNPVIGDRALAEKADDVARLGAAIVRGAAGARASPRAASTFPGTATRSADSHLELPLVEHPPERLREVEFVPFRAAIAAGVATIMTAHVLVPALDETAAGDAVAPHRHRPAARRAGLRRRHPERRSRDEGDRERATRCPTAAVLAIEAGCDGVLICSGDHDTQAAALEALVHAVEEERLPLARVEDALRRQQRAKERFLRGAGRRRGRSRRRRCAQALGRDEHRAIADEMARFL